MWVLLQTETGREKSLFREEDCDSYFLPQMTIVTRPKRKRKPVEAKRALFPGYLFVRHERLPSRDMQVWSRVVTGAGAGLILFSDGDLLAVKAIEDEIERQRATIGAEPFISINGLVQVIKGAAEGSRGIVVAIRKNGKVLLRVKEFDVWTHKKKLLPCEKV